MIPPHRKTQLNKLAGFIANDFSDGNLTLLNKIAGYEYVPVYFDNYEYWKQGGFKTRKVYVCA